MTTEQKRIPAVLTTEQLNEAYALLREGFSKLGFKPLEDPTSHGLGVYLVHNFDRNELTDRADPSRPVSEADFWLRISVDYHPMLGQRAHVDFKAGPMFWLEVAQPIKPKKDE